MLKRMNYILLGVVLVNSCVCFGVDDESIDYPYKAVITGDGVYIRSGSAEMYYFTGQLNKGDEVIVADKRFSWCKIDPPKGSFSWIAKMFVEIDKNDPSVGIVNKDDTGVWAGTEHLDPEDSTTDQRRLSKGDKVTLLGEEKGDYYKIAPPDGAYLWVKDDYVKYVSPVEFKTVKIVEVEKKTEEKKPEKVKDTAKKEVKKEEVKKEQAKEEKTPDVIVREPEQPKMTPEEMKRVKEVYGIVKEVDAERAKDLSEQDYGKIKAKLSEIVADEKAGKAVKYAKYQLDRIAGYELAKEVAAIINKGDEELLKLRAKLAARRQAVHKKVRSESVNTLEGVIRASKIYDSKNDEQRYIILGEQGNIICYAKAGAGIRSVNMRRFLGKKVGLKGNFTPDTGSGISLMEIEEIKVIE